MDEILYHSIGTYLKKRFGCRVVKLAIDGGFTCPNRDGSKGSGGCIFCSPEGSGELASEISDIDQQVSLLAQKWPDSKYIAYFQSYTSTYAPVEALRAKYEEALKSMQNSIEAKRKELLEQESSLQIARDFVSGETSKKLSECSFREISQKEYNEQKQALLN